jgi:hypothetical protein
MTINGRIRLKLLHIDILGQIEWVQASPHRFAMELARRPDSLLAKLRDYQSPGG